MLAVLPNYDFKKDEFVSNYLANLSFEFNSVIGNVDKCCGAVIEADYMIDKLQRNSEIIHNVNSTPGPLGGLRTRSLITPPGLKDQKNSLPQKNQLLLSSVSSERNLSTYLANVGYPYYDHSIWFFMKNNLNMLYDYFLGMIFLNEVSSKRFKRFNYRMLSVKSFIRNCDDNFYMLSRMKNWKINSSFACDYNGIENNNYGNSSNTNASESKSSCISSGCGSDEVFVVHSYMRVLFFNLYLFILTSSEDKSTGKEFNISFVLEKNPYFSEYKFSQNLKCQINSSFQCNCASYAGNGNKDNRKAFLANSRQPYDSDLFLSISITSRDTKPKYDFNNLNEILH